jgi:hypothetical protein
VNHGLSTGDRRFRTEFDGREFPPADFDHRAHVRLAYVYLVEHDADAAHELMRSSLLRFLASVGVDSSKYHETMTRAWILAVQHFMTLTPRCTSSDAFMAKNPQVLDSTVMMKHYSAEVLFSDEARATFVEPNLKPIPRHAE